MNGYELECVIRSNPCIQRSVKGVYARNNLPKDGIRYPSTYIVNSDKDDRPGEHWLAIVLESKSHGIFFDSFGRPPEIYGVELKDFLNANVKQYQCFSLPVQSKHSSLCGFFVLTFLMLHVCLKWPIDSIVKFFDSDVNVNDRIVLSFVNEYYNLCQ